MPSIDYRKLSDHEILNLADHISSSRREGDDAPVDHWVTINHHHIPITVPKGAARDGQCPPQKKEFFQALGGIFKMMGNAAHTNPEFIAALSAYESSWLGKHARDLHNPFGLTASRRQESLIPVL